MTHDEKTQTACVLRLFGAPLRAVQQAAQELSEKGVAVRCRSRGAEVLLALQAAAPDDLQDAQKTLSGRFSAELYGKGETTLAHAAVQALETHRRLMVCSDAAAGALLEARLETVSGAEKVFDFGAMSYADANVRAKLDAKTRRVKGGAAAAALARVQAARRFVGTDFAAGCVERAEDTVLFLGSRRGCWVRTVANTDAPALWLLDMIRRAACGLPQVPGTSWQHYRDPVPEAVSAPPAVQAEVRPAPPKKKRRWLRRVLFCWWRWPWPRWRRAGGSLVVT